MAAVETDVSRHYSYPLLTWGSTLLGGVVALDHLPHAEPAWAPRSASPPPPSASHAGASATAGIAGIVWVAIANLVALGFGAWVAARSTANPDHHGGALQGIAVWAVTSFAVLYLASSAISGLGGAVMKTAGIAASASSTTIAQQANRPDAGSSRPDGGAGCTGFHPAKRGRDPGRRNQGGRRNGRRRVRDLPRHGAWAWSPRSSALAWEPGTRAGLTVLATPLIDRRH